MAADDNQDTQINLGDLVVNTSNQVRSCKALRTDLTPDCMPPANRRFLVLDGMRGVAALVVVLYHYYNYKNLPYLRNSYIAVDFFFTLSGFVISYSYRDKLLNGMRSSDYIARRVARLLPMMALGLLIGAIALYAYADWGSSGFIKREIFVSVAYNTLFVPYLSNTRLTGDVIESTGPLFPSDPPLWSIFFEVFVSICFIKLVLMGKKNLFILGVISLLLIIVAGAARGLVGHSTVKMFDGGWNTASFLSGFPRVLFGFVLGMLIFDLRNGDRFLVIKGPKMAKHLITNPLVIYLTLAMALLFPFELGGLYYLVAIIVFSPILVLWGSVAAIASVSTARASHLLGWLSYPIYCLHKPVLSTVQVLDKRFLFTGYTRLSTTTIALISTVVLAGFSASLFDRYLHKRLERMLESSLNKVGTYMKSV